MLGQNAKRQNGIQQSGDSGIFQEVQRFTKYMKSSLQTMPSMGCCSARNYNSSKRENAPIPIKNRGKNLNQKSLILDLSKNAQFLTAKTWKLEKR